MAPALPLFEWQNAFESIAVRQENGDGNGNRIKETIIAVAVSSIVLAILFFVGRGLFLKRQRRSPSVRHSGAGLRGPNDRGIANFPSPAPSLVRLQRMQQQNNGLSMDELDFAAPVKSYVSASDDNNRDKTGDNDDICAVCLEEMEKGTKTRRMPCGHVFDARYVCRFPYTASSFFAFEEGIACYVFEHD